MSVWGEVQTWLGQQVAPVLTEALKDEELQAELDKTAAGAVDSVLASSSVQTTLLVVGLAALVIVVIARR